MEGTAHQENIQHFSPFTGSYASFPCLGLLGAAKKPPHANNQSSRALALRSAPPASAQPSAAALQGGYQESDLKMGKPTQGGPAL